MIPPRLRAGLVIGAVAVASGIAGAAIDRAALARRAPRPESGRRRSSDWEGRRRTDMLDKLTRELALTPAQRAGIDSIFQRTDSSLRAIRHESQPRIQQVFERSGAEVNARLDPAQREKFAKIRRERSSRDYRGGGRGGRGGHGPDSGRQ